MDQKRKPKANRNASKATGRRAAGPSGERRRAGKGAEPQQGHFGACPACFFETCQCAEIARRDASVLLLKAELVRADLQQLTVCRIALLEVEQGRLESALTRLRVDADKLRTYETKINALLKDAGN